MSLAHSTYYDAPMRAADDTARVEAMAAVGDAFEAYGWRRVQAALRQQGWRVNHKRVHRLYRDEGLSLRLKRPVDAVCAKLAELGITPKLEL